MTPASHRASSARSRSAAASPPGEKCAALYMTDTTVSTRSSRSAASVPSGTRSGIPLAAILRFAREMR